MDHRLETRRLEFRPRALGDAGSLHALMIDADVRRWAMDGRVLPEASFREPVLKSIASFRRRGTGAFAIRLREDGAFAGYAGLFPAKLGRLGGLELGAAISPRYRGQGIANEACRAVLAEAFGPLAALPRPAPEARA